MQKKLIAIIAFGLGTTLGAIVSSNITRTRTLCKALDIFDEVVEECKEEFIKSLDEPGHVTAFNAFDVCSVLKTKGGECDEPKPHN